MKIPVKDIKAADRRIKAVAGGVQETPLDESGVLSERTGTTFLLKGEHLQRTGSRFIVGQSRDSHCPRSSC